MTTVSKLQGWLISALVAAVSGMALADAQSDARTQIQSLYDQESAASMKKDVKRIFAHYSPQYTQTDTKGTVHKLKEFQAKLPQMLAALTNIKDKVVIGKITLNGNYAVATVTETSQATFQNSGTRKPSLLKVVETSEDTWVKGPKGWMKRSARSLKSIQSIDGKVVATP